MPTKTHRFPIIMAILSALLIPFALAFAADGEVIPPGETQATGQIVSIIHKGVLAAAQKEGRAFRDAHRKTHGCVNAELSVPALSERDLAQGLFAQAGNYSAVVRFSNGSGSSQDDNVGDGRGMAIKVLGVNGEKELNVVDENANTQDFLMINHPVFFVRNAEEYVKFQNATMSGAASTLLWFMHPKRVFHEFSIAREIRGKEVLNPLQSPYYSMTPSKWGSMQAKFAAFPCGENFRPLATQDSPDRLSENMAAQLAGRSACFDFRVQLRTHPTQMPIEDATLPWPENLSPYQNVARLVIHSQTPDKGSTCEDRAFNPWHTLKAHRPLGGIGRIRKDVYFAIAGLRKKFNKGR